VDLSDVVRTDYASKGFAVIRKAVDPDLLAEVRAHVEWLQAKFPGLRPEHLHHPLMRDDAFWAYLVCHVRLTDVARRFLGPDLACFTAHYICKPPRDGLPVLWHQDGAYWKLAPMEALTVWLAVDRSHRGNGCLEMIPGSHRVAIAPPVLRAGADNMLSSEVDAGLVDEWAERAGIEHVELDPGDLSIHHPNILHRSQPNRSNERRCGLDIGYISTATRIENRGLYMNPWLVSGRARGGVNTYCRLPTYDPASSIDFAERAAWDELARARNQEHPSRDPAVDEAPLDLALRMMARLEAGTVA
jgi:phytanoyl-CoA hydroxylase